MEVGYVPWALHEDVVGFVGKILSEKGTPFEEIKKELTKKYQIVVSDVDIQDALDDLIELGEAKKVDHSIENYSRIHLTYVLLFISITKM
jgi:uncharacterized protein YlxP (DUF503 family)